MMTMIFWPDALLLLNTQKSTVIAALCGSVVSLYNDNCKGRYMAHKITLLPLTLPILDCLLLFICIARCSVGALISTVQLCAVIFSGFVIVQVFNRSRAVVVGVSGFSLVLFSHQHCCLFVNSTVLNFLTLSMRSVQRRASAVTFTCAAVAFLLLCKLIT